MAGFANRTVLAFKTFDNNGVTLFDVPIGSKYLVHNIIIHNPDNGDKVLTLSYSNSTHNETKKLWNVEIEGNETLVIDHIGEGDVYLAGDKLIGSCTSEITIKICGTEER